MLNPHRFKGRSARRNVACFQSVTSCRARATAVVFICTDSEDAHFAPSLGDLTRSLRVQPAAAWHPGAVQTDGPGSVNTSISCRLTAPAVEQKTSSGMNQMKEQIIPSPRMTCSSDPESAFLPRPPPSKLSLPRSESGEEVNVRARSQVISHLPGPLPP